ncbi:hypothetical protein GM3708_2384 [Geminocystis sp. NIES-3708]|uniref:DUF4340 domain-containing protein n=1 Tax=Geminocystis sp. NIES-3708 TaxID=1615909 RepID=UPI0005FC9B7B|nr:DUF4340 domain-containing protein [Geminocystis sp. NIES-3708]BAQ61978.1 hypothetical protein GM3708_2384 [Geminocystis sp. NIES-3708]
MKFNRTTIFLVILALGLTAFVFLREIKDQGFDITPKIQNQNEGEKIFTFDTNDIKNITIKINDKKISFEKIKNKNQSWQMTQPEKIIASNAAISFLINLFSQAENKVEIPSTKEKRQEFGLDISQYQIWLTLNNGEEYHMILGKSNFDNTQIYAEVTFPKSVKSQQNIFLVSKSFQYAIERDFEEWKALNDDFSN